MFFTELLGNAYQVEFATNGVLQEAIDTSNDRIVFWQRPPSSEQLKIIPASSIVFVPMYDEARNYSRETIRSWAPFKIISFCRSMHEDLVLWGFNSKYVQYFPKPMLSTPLLQPEQKAFFWRRESSYINEAIPANIVRRLFYGTGLQLHLHSENKLDDEHEIADMITSRSSWFSDKTEMLSILRECSLYVAPRESEGIGMSFLDAMANGLAIVGADNPTMNEYITDEVNGYLFDLMKPKPLDLENLAQVRQRSLETCQTGFEKWEKEKWSLIEFIEEKKAPPMMLQVPRGFEYHSLKQKNIFFKMKRFAKKLAGI